MQRHSGRNLGAIILIGLGAFFLLTEMGILSANFIWSFWPVFIIGPGLVFLYFAVTGDKDLAPLAIPGALVTGTGAILLYQSITNHWESWAYVWALYPVFLGMGLLYMGRRGGSDQTARAGAGFIRWGLIGFLVFGAFFEAIVFNDFGLGRFVMPGLLILAGLWLLTRRGGKGKRAPNDNDVYPPDPPPNRRHRPTASERLRQEIDAALANEDEPFPPPDDDPFV